MAIVNRISRLFKADFHAVLDQLEEPEQLLKQAIRDMADELVATEQRIAAFAHEEERLAARVGELEAALIDVNLQLDLCFRSGRDELAKKMIRRKLEAERLLKRLEANRHANEARRTEERRLFDDNSSALQGLRQKAELFARRSPGGAGHTGDADDIAWMARQMSVSEEEVEIAWLREKDSRTAA
jgi:phage shock protein A